MLKIYHLQLPACLHILPHNSPLVPKSTTIAKYTNGLRNFGSKDQARHRSTVQPAGASKKAERCIHQNTAPNNHAYFSCASIARLVDLRQNIGSLDFWLPFYQEKGKCPSGKEEKNTTMALLLPLPGMRAGKTVRWTYLTFNYKQSGDLLQTHISQEAGKVYTLMPISLLGLVFGSAQK